ncbi:MAG: hypothetical protein WC357_00555 [Candidatus Omnitrophota bacterium]|jgi:hypothetical protein
MLSREDKTKIIGQLFASELQFRLASAVRLATAMKKQPLDLPMEWVYGKHRVKYSEVALRQDQADYDAWLLCHSVTFLIATEIKNAIVAVIPNPINHRDKNVSNAFQIARFIRNAFPHHPFRPVWSIEKKYQDKKFSVADIIELDTAKLHGQSFNWRHYGGPLAILRLPHFVRFKILKDNGKKPWERMLPKPKNKYIQQGSLILEEVERVPKGAKKI